MAVSSKLVRHSLEVKILPLTRMVHQPNQAVSPVKTHPLTRTDLQHRTASLVSSVGQVNRAKMVVKTRPPTRTDLHRNLDSPVSSVDLVNKATLVVKTNHPTRMDLQRNLASPVSSVDLVSRVALAVPRQTAMAHLAKMLVRMDRIKVVSVRVRRSNLRLATVRLDNSRDPVTRTMLHAVLALPVAKQVVLELLIEMAGKAARRRQTEATRVVGQMVVKV